MGRGNRERRFVRCSCGRTEIVLDPYALPPRKCRSCRSRTSENQLKSTYEDI